MSGIKLPMRVWDLPIRLFHWCLVVLVVTSYVSIKTGWMEIHFASGYSILALLLFRLVWGVAGSDTARFAKFVKSPAAAIADLRHFRRREPDTMIGHNAAGGWMVVLLLALLSVQVGTGLFANDEDIGIYQGSLAHFVSKAASDRATAIHSFTINLILAAVAVHVVAVILYAVVKGQDLVRPMINGKKRLPGAMRAPRMRSPVFAAAVFACAAAIAFTVSRL